MIALLLLLATSDPTTTERHCDRIEVNTVWHPEHDWQGGVVQWKPQLTQVIYWEWRHGAFRVAGWRLVKGDPPMRDHRGVVDYTVQGDRSFTIRAPEMIETATPYDPERRDKETWPEHLRPDWFKKKPPEVVEP